MADAIVGMQFPITEGTEGTPAANTDPDKIVMDSVILICSTSKGEMEMKPDFGSIAMDMVFETDSVSAALAIKFDLQTTLRRYEPRVRLIDVTFEVDAVESTLLVMNVFFLNLLTQSTLQAEITVATGSGV